MLEPKEYVGRFRKENIFYCARFIYQSAISDKIMQIKVPNTKTLFENINLILINVALLVKNKSVFNFEF